MCLHRRSTKEWYRCLSKAISSICGRELLTVIMLDAREQYDAECNRRGMSEAQREIEKIFGFDDVEYADDSIFFK